MPTRREVAKIKADFIDSREKLIRSKISQKQLDLFDELFNKYLSSLSGKEFSSAEELKVISKIEKAVKDFSIETNSAILKEYTASATSLGDLNMAYFATMFDDPKRLDLIKQKTQESLNKRLGLNEDGSLKKSGFVDKMIADKSIQAEVVRETKKAISNNYDVNMLKDSFKKIIVGTEDSVGIFERHYNTFAKDILNTIDNSNSKIFADELGLKHAYYSGGLMKSSRPFCIKHNGKIFTQDQIDNFKNDPLIQDMYGANIDEYDPNELPGGYGCKHSLDYITADLAIGFTREQNKKAAERNQAFKDRNNL
jgi:hypothetical protein